MTFAYDGSEPVLRDVDLTVEPGRTVALVGTSRVRQEHAS